MVGGVCLVVRTVLSVSVPHVLNQRLKDPLFKRDGDIELLPTILLSSGHTYTYTHGTFQSHSHHQHSHTHTHPLSEIHIILS